ncbi:unnamed protein product [Penicillium roqueforti FM164]|uniref:Genomic scaffold, ProqFM164S02 n=1 Tax=Penicillium roqueforti (strain FM164) TaxID=1365484 RepID=W6QF90_PENRF|nr:unnamed protein product [Penicillium roqueforti FM164]
MFRNSNGYTVRPETDATTYPLRLILEAPTPKRALYWGFFRSTPVSRMCKLLLLS